MAWKKAQYSPGRKLSKECSERKSQTPVKKYYSKEQTDTTAQQTRALVRCPRTPLLGVWKIKAEINGLW